MVEIYQQVLEDYKKKLESLYSDMKDASPLDAGSYNIKIKQLEDDIQKLEKSIEKTKKNDKLFLYIITGTNAKVKAALGEELFAIINPPDHDDTDHYKWKPFVNEEATIKDLIGFFKAKGYPFEEYYFYQWPKIEQLVEIDKNIENSIAIIDLMALDDENKKLASRFNTSKSQVITPLCYYRDRQITDFMVKKRKEIFDIGEFYFFKGEMCNFYPELISRGSFLMELGRIFKDKMPDFKIISDQNSAYNNKIRTALISPSF